MDENNRNWILIMDDGSQFSNITGAYQLKTIMKCKEMNILPKFRGR
jgi:hypothetical protein